MFLLFVIGSAAFGWAWEAELTAPEGILREIPEIVESSSLHQKIKDLLSCSKCVAGQTFLWSYPITLTIGSYSPVYHFFGIFITILSTAIINKLIERL